MWSKTIRNVAASGTATNMPRIPAQLKPAISATTEGESSTEAREPLSVRVQRLEEQLATLTAEFHALRAKLGE